MTVTISALSSNSLGGYFGEITGFNSQGVAVGSDGTAAIWQSGKVSALSGLTYADSINDSGEIAGLAFNSATFDSNAAILQNGKVTLLPTLGGTVTSYSEAANGINDAGEVVGASAAQGGLVEACLWQNGQATNLGTLTGGTAPLSLGYFNSDATAINGAGQIAGYSLTTGNVYHATLWQNGAITDLGVFAAGDQSFATAINSKGQVVGYDMPASFESKAFLWQNGTMTNLGTLPGDDYSTAEAINDSGVIVGQAGIYANPSGNHAVMWQDGKIIDLNTLLAPNSGWYLQTADAINDNGVIVGRGSLLNGGGDGTYEMVLTGTVAVMGSSVQSALQAGVTTPAAVVDSGANVLAGLDGLEALQQKGLLTSVTLTDSAKPHWTLTASQFDADNAVLSVLVSPVVLTVTGGAVSAIAAAALPAQDLSLLTAPLSVSDSGSNVDYELDALETASKAGAIGTITLDSGEGVTFSVAQYQQDSDLLSHVANAAFVAISDSPAAIGANLDLLQTLVVSGKIDFIDLPSYSQAVQTLPLTSSQLANDQNALYLLQPNIDLAVTPSSATASIDGDGYGVTVVLAGAAASYSVSSAGNGTGFTVTGASESHKINNVTALQFSDHTEIVASQTPLTAGGVSSSQVASLYAAVLAREPDVGGLAFYEATAAHGDTSIVTFAEYFLNSTEYTSAHKYAQTAQGDAQFITDTYTNLLHRAPEAGAVAFYQNNVINPMLSGLTAGTSAYTKAELVAHATVLTYFSNSAEFLGDVGVTAQHPADASHWLLLI